MVEAGHLADREREIACGEDDAGGDLARQGIVGRQQSTAPAPRPARARPTSPAMRAAPTARHVVSRPIAPRQRRRRGVLDRGGRGSPARRARTPGTAATAQPARNRNAASIARRVDDHAGHAVAQRRAQPPARADARPARDCSARCPCVRSATTTGNSAPKMPAPMPSRTWIDDQQRGVCASACRAGRAPAGRRSRRGTSACVPSHRRWRPTSIAIGTITTCAVMMQAAMNRLPAAAARCGELLAEQRQHRGVGEMEQGDRGGEDQQRAVLEQQREPGRLAAPSSPSSAPRASVWSMRLADRSRSTATMLAAPSTDDDPEHRAGRDELAGDARRDRGDGVAAMVERLVAADAAGEQPRGRRCRG